MAAKGVFNRSNKSAGNRANSDDGSINPDRLYTRKEAMHPLRLPVSRITLIRLEAKKVLIPIRLDPSPKSSVFYSGENLLQARQSRPEH